MQNTILRDALPNGSAPQDDVGAVWKFIAKFYFAFGSTAGSTVCTAPGLRTWMVAMSSE